MASARAHALLAGRDYVTPHDVKTLARDVLRHRVLASYEADAEGVTPDDLIRRILERIRVEGPLGSRDFDGVGGGGMWSWKPAKMVLDALWDRGQLVIAERRSFQRQYELAERVIPKQALEAPTPSDEETLRTFAVLAVAARGALTEAAIREHWRWKGGRAI